MQVSRRINHTGRRRIGRSEVRLELRERESYLEFDASFQLDRENLPADAELRVEAYHKNTSQRFDFGTVGAPVPPASTRLTEIDLSGPVLFRVKVVDRDGKLLAAADRVRPEDESNHDSRESLMTIAQRDLQQLPWRVDFSDDANPTLCINNRFPDAIGQFFRNSTFQALILPGAFREVLIFILWNRNGEPEEGTWEEKWLRFAEHVAPTEMPDDSDPSQLIGWVDDIVREFSSKHELCEVMIRHLEGGGQ